MSIDTPNICEPEQTINRLNNLARQVQRLRQSMGISMVAEELDIPRDTVIMLSGYSR